MLTAQLNHIEQGRNCAITSEWILQAASCRDLIRTKLGAIAREPGGVSLKNDLIIYFTCVGEDGNC